MIDSLSSSRKLIQQTFPIKLEAHERQEPLVQVDIMLTLCLTAFTVSGTGNSLWQSAGQKGGNDQLGEGMQKLQYS